MGETLLAIVSDDETAYTHVRLAEAAEASGVVLLWLRPAACAVLAGAPPALLHEGRPLPRPDVALPLTGASTDVVARAVLSQLAAGAVPLVDPAPAVACACNKFDTIQTLCGAGLPVPRTALVERREDLAAVAAFLGGPPVVAKPIQGTHGENVRLANTLAEAERAIEACEGDGRRAILQEVLGSGHHEDIRVIVLGGHALGAMLRRARPGSFASNISRGGSAMPVDPTEELARLAVDAARALGLGLAGVDLMRGEDGTWRVLEVNSAPEFQGFERATRIDVADAIIAHAASLAESAPPSLAVPVRSGSR